LNYILYLILIAILWLFLNIFYLFKKEYFNNRNLRIYYGIILVYRKPSTIKTHRVFKSKTLVYLNIILFTIVLTLFYYSMISSIMVKTGFLKGIPAQLLLPGVNITGIDLLFFLIAVAIAATIHELMHAYTAVSRGIRVKSIGFTIIFILPVAFTEVDEKDFDKTTSRNRVVVLSAGPVSNFLLALVANILLVLFIAPYGLAILEVQSNSLAWNYGLKPGDIIVKINDTEASVETLFKYMSIEDDIDLKLLIISNGAMREIIVHKPFNTTRLGVRITGRPVDFLIKSIGQYSSILLLLAINWIYVVNLGLALVNAAPLFISDGGRVFYELFKNKNIGHIVNTISLLILILAVAPIQ